MTDVTTMINPLAQAVWPITIGDSIKATKRAASLTAIRYNHLPKLNVRSDATQSIRQSKGKESCEASIRYGEQEWNYTGASEKTEDSYILVLNEDSGRKTATLERITTSIALNIISTPEESSAARLQQKYQQLSVADEQDHGQHKLLDHEDNSPDLNNPFDYRHFLEEVTGQARPADAPKSSMNTPIARPVTTASKTSAAALTTKKRKSAVETSLSASKRAKPAQQAPPRAKTSKPDNVPSVRLERRATIPVPPPDDDDGELILENDDAPRDSHRSAMAMALNGSLSQHGNGPISLRSAASSPASRMHSPAVVGDEELELGGADDNADVEHFGLPSPAHAPRNAVQTTTVVDDDDDDDLEKQLAEAMEQDDAAPEEEESEEE